ncbi:MAG: ABC transporter substrate-binding protein [Candidatus Binatia bacterium]|nr:ABC transporter substrate-binding protein [Candidatus Binatia bacterium]
MIHLGVLDDTPHGVDRPLLERALELAGSRTKRTGRFHEPIQLHIATADGLPRGTARDVEDAFAELAARDVLGVLGPAIGDNALIATPLAETHALPTVNFAGTERARGEHMFHLQIGSHEEEPVLLARQLSRGGHARVSVLFERATIGLRYATFFESACSAVGLPVANSVGLDPGSDPADAVHTALRASPDALVYLGLGLDLPAVSAALGSGNFAGTRACNSCGMFGWAGPPYDAAVEGWCYIDVFSEENPGFRDARRALGLADDAGPTGVLYADLATLVVEGLAHAPELSRRGLRDGLEQVKALPAALGLPGTQLGFGTWDRGALKGPYLVPRKWLDGRSVAWTA